MITKFEFWFWQQFPEYWHLNDSNKDVNNKGTAERLLETMGLEIDEELVDKLDVYLDNLDAQICAEEMLVHISDCLGNPPNIFLDVQKWRNLLSYILAIYKVKGTVKGYEAFYNLLGYDVIITEYPNITLLYDDGVLFDEDDELLLDIYDSACEPCSKYTIEFSTQDDDLMLPAPISLETLAKLQEAVYFVEPINALLISTTFAIYLAEEFTVVITEFLTVTMLDTSNYDFNDFDDFIQYDQDNSIVVFSGPI